MSQLPQLVEVYRASNVPEAHAVRVGLEQIGIRAYIQGETLQIAVGELPMGWLTAPRVLVEGLQLNEARAYITQFEKHRQETRTISAAHSHPDVTECLACGAIMSEFNEKCPVCGWSFVDEGETLPSD
jgi:Putative prokaryotic signal transducing protein